MDELESRLEQLLAERAEVPVAADGDPVALVERRMRRRHRRVQLVAACAAALAVVATGLGLGFATHFGAQRRGSVAPHPTPPPASSLSLNGASSVAVDRDGSLLIAEASRVIRRSPDGHLQLIAGTGVAGFGGDGASATLAQLNNPRDIAIGHDGTIYVADTANNRVRAISPDGTIRTLLGNGEQGDPVDGQPAVDTAVSSPQSVAVAPNGDVYVGESSDLVRVSSDGIVHVVIAARDPSSGTAIGPSFPPSLSPLAFDASSLAFDSAGDLYIGVNSEKTLIRLSSAGTLTSVAAQIYVSPGGLSTAPDGSILVADYGDFAIDRIVENHLSTMTAFISTPVSGIAHPLRPAAVAESPDGMLYMVDDGEATGSPSVYAISPGGAWGPLSVRK
jgi:sugar lactone lactonase YvrE